MERLSRPLPGLPADLQHRGHRGGRIAPHRSIWGLQLPRRRLAGGLLLAAALTAALLALRPVVGPLWAQLLGLWVQALGLPVQTVAPMETADWPWQLVLPQYALALHAPALPTLGWSGAVVALLWWLGGRLGDAWRPALYLLRFALLIHAAALVFFWFWPASFVHTAAEHVAQVLQQSWALMLLAPWLHLCCHWLFEGRWRQRLALTGLTWAWLLLLAPHLAALHLLVMARFGVLAMPLLQLLFGVMVQIIGFVALYGWAMSWANAHLLRRLED